jgi:hypothetical protein
MNDVVKGMVSDLVRQEVSDRYVVGVHLGVEGIETQFFADRTYIAGPASSQVVSVTAVVK